MNRPRNVIGAAMTSVLLACAAAVLATPKGAAQEDVFTDPARASQQIIVTFADRSIARPSFGTPERESGYGFRYRTSSWGRRVSDALAREYDLRKVTEWPIRTLGVQCVVYEIPAGKDLQSVIESVGRDRRVRSAQPMNVFRALAAEPPRSGQYAHKALHVDAAHRYATGRNVVIAVVDTGVDTGHPDLQGQVIEHQDLVFDPNSAFDDDVHGTAVAGVIAALGREQMLGVAPGAKLLALKACWPSQPGVTGALCSSLTLARALDAALERHPAIVNLSLAGPRDPLLEELLRAMIGKGLIVVAACPEAADAAQAFPTSVAGVLRARAASPAPPDCNAQDMTPVNTPGTDILTTFPRARYDFVSGNSFAAAHVSGIVALLLELKPALSAMDASTILQRAMHGDGSVEVARPELTIVNACEAIRQVRQEIRCDPDPIARHASERALRRHASESWHPFTLLRLSENGFRLSAALRPE
jgi:subtilisin family serine protease